MTADELTRCIRLATQHWHQATKTWDEGTVEAWERQLTDLDVSLVVGVIETMASDGREWPPNPGQVRQRAVQIALKLPTAEGAWTEIRTQIAAVGSLRGTMRWTRDKDNNLIDIPIEPVWSHPLVGRVADALGWDDLCQSENMMADRAHFLHMWGEAVNREHSEKAMTPLATAMFERAGIALPNLSAKRALDPA